MKLLRFFEPIGMTLAHIKHHHKRNVASKYQPRRAFRSIYFARFSENSESYKNAMSLENQNFLKKCSFPKLLWEFCSYKKVLIRIILCGKFGWQICLLSVKNGSCSCKSCTLYKVCRMKNLVFLHNALKIMITIRVQPVFKL